MESIITYDTLELFKSKPSIAVLMSGTGSNARSILENTEVRQQYDVRLIATDNSGSNAEQLANEYGLDYLEQPVDRFIDSSERDDYFKSLGLKLGEAGIQGLFYAGFMKISTKPFSRAFPGVNVHPADLTIIGEDGLPVYRGMNALPNMVKDLGYAKATVHVIDTPVDSGSSLAVSEALTPESNETPIDLHERLKVLENELYPATLAAIARGELTVQNLPALNKLPGGINA
jgi:folate-dependent phosphoribosylglycinamide formyltransferase PurN